MDYAKDALKVIQHNAAALSAFIDTLVELREMAPNVPHSFLGICGNWEKLLQQKNIYDSFTLYSLVGSLARSWPHTWEPRFSTWRPIRNPRNLPLWEGEQLELRLSLMDHILACLRDYQAQQETSDV